jgi:tRNA A-37 threonylcarbamoyl transferase component Bud32
VYEGTLDEQTVIIKVFSHRMHGRRHFRREARGLEQLAQRNIPAPRLLTTGRNKHGRVMVIEKIDRAEDVSTLFNRMSNAETQSLLKPVMNLLAQMHSKGVLQKDLHLGNFLWDGKRVYAMDPAQMRFFETPVGRPQSYRQLGNLATMFWDDDRSLKADLFEVYFQARGWTLDDSAIDTIEHFAKAARARGLEHTLQKTLRTCTEFVRHTSRARSGVFDRTVFEGMDVSAFMGRLNDLMENGDILKRGNSCLVSRIRLNGQEAVIKRYHYKGTLHALRHTLKGSRAKKCWLFGHRLRRLGIATAKPLAFIEQRSGGLLYESYFISEFVEGPTLYWLLKDAAACGPSAAAALEQTDRLIGQLIDNGLTHSDLKLSNMLFRDTEPVLIDLDSMQRHRWKPALTFYAKKMSAKFHRRLAALQEFTL